MRVSLFFDKAHLSWLCQAMSGYAVPTYNRGISSWIFLTNGSLPVYPCRSFSDEPYVKSAAGPCRISSNEVHPAIYIITQAQQVLTGSNTRYR